MVIKLIYSSKYEETKKLPSKIIKLFCSDFRRGYGASPCFNALQLYCHGQVCDEKQLGNDGL